MNALSKPNAWQAVACLNQAYKVYQDDNPTSFCFSSLYRFSPFDTTGLMPAAPPQMSANPFYNHLMTAAPMNPAALAQLQIPTSTMSAIPGIPVNASSLQQVAAHQQVQQQQQQQQQAVQHVPQVPQVQQVQQMTQAAGMQTSQAQAAAGGMPTGWWQYM